MTTRHTRVISGTFSTQVPLAINHSIGHERSTGYSILLRLGRKVIFFFGGCGVWEGTSLKVVFLVKDLPGERC